MKSSTFKRLTAMFLGILFVAAASTASFAGGLPGPGSTVDSVARFDTDTCPLVFEAGEQTRVVVGGDGDTDLDCVKQETLQDDSQASEERAEQWRADTQEQGTAGKKAEKKRRKEQKRREREERRKKTKERGAISDYDRPSRITDKRRITNHDLDIRIRMERYLEREFFRPDR